MDYSDYIKSLREKYIGKKSVLRERSAYDC